MLPSPLVMSAESRWWRPATVRELSLLAGRRRRGGLVALRRREWAGFRWLRELQRRGGVLDFWGFGPNSQRWTNQDPFGENGFENCGMRNQISWGSTPTSTCLSAITH